MMNGRCGMTLQLYGLALAAIGIVTAYGGVSAADYDQAYHPARPRAAAGTPGRMAAPLCRVVPMPEADLFLDTTRFRPQVVCISRGMVADSFGPNPSYEPYYNNR